MGYVLIFWFWAISDHAPVPAAVSTGIYESADHCQAAGKALQAKLAGRTKVEYICTQN